MSWQRRSRRLWRRYRYGGPPPREVRSHRHRHVSWNWNPRSGGSHQGWRPTIQLSDLPGRDPDPRA